MALSQRYRLLAPVALMGAAALVLAGCAEGGTEGGGDGSGDAKTTVRISGGITGGEADALNESFAQFTEDTGIKVEYTGDKSFEGNIVAKVTGGDAPDIAIVPQPGLLKTLVETGKVLPASEAVESAVDENWSPDWKKYGTFDDTFYAAPMLANLKGYVWYSPKQFAEWGVEVPKTWDEMIALTDKIVQTTGGPAWCAGFASDAASGWPGTDWLEDYVLRTAGADVYDQWVSHEIPFDSPEIVSALDRVGDLIKDDANVNGGIGDVTTIATTDFGEAGLPVLDGECAMHHQASFYEGFWGEDAVVAEDGDVWAFILPGEEAGAADVTGGGELVGAFDDSEETVAVQTYLSSDTWANSRVSLGGVLSANSGLDPENASSDLLRQAYEILQDPNTTFRFDGSDLMPGAVGSGTLWTGMVDWISGTDSASMLATVEQSWP